VQGAAAAGERATDRFPVGAVRVNAPDAPGDAVAISLRLLRAEDEAPVLEDDGMERPGDVEVTDLFHVAAVVVHDEQLQGLLRGAAWCLERVAVADEGDLAAGQRAGPQVIRTGVAQTGLAIFR